jgi:uncharacterized radical SAM protein YgiQ
MNSRTSKYDVIFVMPYPFSDHPSFPEGTLKRILEANGFRVGIIETPFWQKPESFKLLGAPSLFFAIIPGPVDSIVLNYTSSRKRRREDLYQFEGKAYFDGYPPSIKYKIRPDLTVVVYANRLRQEFKDTPIVIGGTEASLRRFVHYDFQKDKLKRSILLDSRADLLVTGMGEKQILSIAQNARNGVPVKELDIPGTARISKEVSMYKDYVTLASHQEIMKDPILLMNAALGLEKARNAGSGIIQGQDNRFVVEHPPQTYTAGDLDTIYGHDYTRQHIDGRSPSPALQMNLFSVTSHRGCGGGCSFCSISLHEGKRIISRSSDSILEEIDRFRHHPQWKGIISDIGGATAEMYGTDCTNLKCKKNSCLYTSTCKHIRSANQYLKLLRSARKLPHVKNIFLGSGIRYDLMLQNPELLEEIMVYHAGKFLRVAPEHTEKPVLDLMRKPGFEVFENFVHLFDKINRKLKRKIILAPYLIIGHPGETMNHVKSMLRRLRKLNLSTTDVQIFTPTPGTLSTAMYFTECSLSGESIPVDKSIRSLLHKKSTAAPSRKQS